MARSNQLSNWASERMGNVIVANYQQAIFAQAGWNTTSTLALVEASPKFIAIPPVLSPSYSNHLLLNKLPIAVELFRDQEFYLAFNSTVTSQSAWIPGGAVKLITLNPGVSGDTIAFVAVTGTDVLRVNWIQD